MTRDCNHAQTYRTSQSTKNQAKLFSLNLNAYRNEHHMTLNKAKVNFKLEMEEQIRALPTFKKVRLTYVMYPATKHLTDVGNVCSVVDKFFADALVELGKFLMTIIFTFLSWLFGWGL